MQLPTVNLAGLIRGSGRQVYTGLLNRSFSNVGSDRAIQIKLGPIFLATAIAAMLLYKEGEASVNPYAKRGSWAKILAESFAGFWIADNTKGIFPLWGIAMSAYKAGQKPNVLEKLQAGVSTATTLMLGYLGVHLGASISEGANLVEEREMTKRLGENSLQQYVDTLKTSTNEELKGFGELMDKLKLKLNEQDAAYQKGTQQDWTALKPLKREIAGLKADLMEKFVQLEDQLKPQGADALKHFQIFGNVLKKSQETYIKLVRYLNPVFGYALIGMLTGAPVAKAINNWVAAKWPQLKTKKVPSPFTASAFPEFKAAHGPQSPTLIMPDIGMGVLH